MSASLLELGKEEVKIAVSTSRPKIRHRIYETLYLVIRLPGFVLGIISVRVAPRRTLGGEELTAQPVFCERDS